MTPRRLGLDSRVYVLEAVAGSGIAVGWRHIIERSLGAGTPVVLGGELDGACYDVLTGNGRRGAARAPLPRHRSTWTETEPASL